MSYLEFMLMLWKFVVVFVGDEKLFFKEFNAISLLLQLPYKFLSFASESRVAKNVILLQMDVLWIGKI